MAHYRSLLLLTFLLGWLLLSCSRLSSVTTIHPGKPFELGSNPHGSFTVQLTNVGHVPIVCVEQPTMGQPMIRGTFQPGDSQTYRFSAGSTVLFQNFARQSAQLRLVVTGDKHLSMREVSN